MTWLRKKSFGSYPNIQDIQSQLGRNGRYDVVWVRIAFTEKRRINEYTSKIINALTKYKLYSIDNMWKLTPFGAINRYKRLKKMPKQQWRQTLQTFLGEQTLILPKGSKQRNIIRLHMIDIASAQVLLKMYTNCQNNVFVSH